MQFDKDMNSPYKALFLATRTFILSLNGVTEEKKERITTYHFNNKGLCHVRTTKKGVDVGLLKGAQLNDPYNQLHGKTKKMRVYSMQQLNQEILAYYLQSSIDLIRRK